MSPKKPSDLPGDVMVTAGIASNLIAVSLLRLLVGRKVISENDALSVFQMAIDALARHGHPLPGQYQEAVVATIIAAASDFNFRVRRDD